MIMVQLSHLFNNVDTGCTPPRAVLPLAQSMHSILTDCKCIYINSLKVITVRCVYFIKGNQPGTKDLRFFHLNFMLMDSCKCFTHMKSYRTGNTEGVETTYFAIIADPMTSDPE